MLDDPRDLNRDLGQRNPGRDRYASGMSEGAGYALPLALLAIVLMIGGLLVFAPMRSESTKTAENGSTTQRQVQPPAAPVQPAPQTTPQK